jgi:hypothetical protein
MSATDESNALAASKDSIRKVFEVDHPEEDLLGAYEETARQKLSDFADYLKIVSDTTMNIKFREQAAEMVKRLFVNGGTRVGVWAKAYSYNDISTLDELTSKGLSKGFHLWIQPENIKVDAPLAARNDSICTGRLSFYQNCLPFDSLKSPSKNSQMVSVDIFIIKRIKSFGDEKLNVWELYLGNFN